jgi:transposase InsO family protein
MFIAAHTRAHNGAAGASYANVSAIVDSGAASHFFGKCDKAYFKNFTSFGANAPQVIVANGNIVRALGRGQLGPFRNVTLVPGLALNMLSVSQAIRDGYDVEFPEDLTCRIKLADNEILRANCEDGLYTTNIRVPLEKANGKYRGCYSAPIYRGLHRNLNYANVAKFNKAVLWHCRLGHPSWRKLRVLNKKLKLGIPQSHFRNKSICEACVQAKSTKISVPKVASRPRSDTMFKLVHMDICGPFKTKSDAGEEYALILVDDCTRTIWVYPLVNKSDAFSAFQVFVGTEVRSRGPDKRVHVLQNLRTDNDGVFTSHRFKTYCVESGIKQELTVPDLSSQNGVAERFIRKVIQTMRSLLIFSGLPLFLWPYAIKCAAYLLNRLPTRSNPGNKCPLQMEDEKADLRLDKLKVLAANAGLMLRLVVNSVKKNRVGVIARKRKL